MQQQFGGSIVVRWDINILWMILHRIYRSFSAAALIKSLWRFMMVLSLVMYMQMIMTFCMHRI